MDRDRAKADDVVDGPSALEFNTPIHRLGVSMHAIIGRLSAVGMLVLMVGACLFAGSPPSSSAKSSRGCYGVHVTSGSNLRSVMVAHPAGTTYCLTAGTFRVRSPIITQKGDRLIGAGRDSTFIDGNRMDRTAEAIFVVENRTYFARFEIFGAPTPRVRSGRFCNPKPNCGRAFKYSGSRLTIRSVDCHDNGNNCIGGGGPARVVVHHLDCWANGNRYSMTPEFRSAACIKISAVYEPGNHLKITNSYVHDNRWIGLWCDFCEYGLFDVEDNRIIHNGSTGLAWEMSGGWSSTDRALVTDNVIRRNNYRTVPGAGGLAIDTANDITVSGNRFRRNVNWGVRIFYDGSRGPPQPDSRGVVVTDNVMRGDAVVGCELAGVACLGNV
ncbi:MAG: right-handed parallel beta-helix repeat-containing protein [Actinomycetota bacterium]|nr:right-handed parallel beta-helix repeat-containing protein [Actinomycetota bacterium]